MNRILGYYKNDGTKTCLHTCDYIVVELLGKHAKEKDSNMLVSKDSLELILEFRWYLGKDGYPMTHGTEDRKIVYGKGGMKLHHMLFPKVKKGMVIDHINRNKLDNRLENLRVCTPKQNSYNTSKRFGKYKGVSKTKSGYKVTIYKDGIKHEINDINDEKSAAHIYDMMAEELFGEYAGKNYENSFHS